jgi:hypothetical protein
MQSGKGSGFIFYSLDNGDTWTDMWDFYNSLNLSTAEPGALFQLDNVKTFKLKVIATYYPSESGSETEFIAGKATCEVLALNTPECPSADNQWESYITDTVTLDSDITVSIGYWSDFFTNN